MASNEGSNEHLQLMTQPDPNSQSGANSPNYATTNTAASILSSDLSNAYQAVPATQVVGPPSNLPFGNLNSQPQGNFSISNVSQFGTPYTLATGQQVLQWSEETVNVVTACFSNMRPDDGIPTLARMLSGDLPFQRPRCNSSILQHLARQLCCHPQLALEPFNSIAYVANASS